MRRRPRCELWGQLRAPPHINSGMTMADNWRECLLSSSHHLSSCLPSVILSAAKDLAALEPDPSLHGGVTGILSPYLVSIHAPFRDKCCISRYNEHCNTHSFHWEESMPVEVFISYAHKDRKLRDELAALVTLHHQPSVWRWPVAAAISIACSMRWRVTASLKVGQTCVPERQSRAKRTYAWARLEPGPCCGGDQRYCLGTGRTCNA